MKIQPILALCCTTACVGIVFHACTMVGCSPANTFDAYIVKPVENSEKRGDVANWIDHHGGDSRSTRPTQAPKSAPAPSKPSGQRSTPGKTKRK